MQQLYLTFWDSRYTLKKLFAYKVSNCSCSPEPNLRVSHVISWIVWNSDEMFTSKIVIMLRRASWPVQEPVAPSLSVVNTVLFVSPGIPDDKDGLFDTIQRSKNHYQKRAYQCIKFMVTLFCRSVRSWNLQDANSTAITNYMIFHIFYIHSFLRLRVLTIK